MRNLTYIKLEDLDPSLFLPLLNSETTRAHLMPHAAFEIDNLEQWRHAKMEMDRALGCRVRAVLAGDQLAGWCAIQPSEQEHEIAIVLDHQYWGLGRAVFREMMVWARELGHRSVALHLLHTRPEYRFLRKMAREVRLSEIMGHHFTTYILDVPE